MSLRKTSAMWLSGSVAAGVVAIAGMPGLARASGAVDLAEVGARCAPTIHPTTLRAVVMQESGGRPFAIGINGGRKLARQPQTKAEAVATAKRLMREGYDFDAGLGQINVRNFNWLGLTVEDVFDPCINLQSAARVLGDCFGRAQRSRPHDQAALRAALSCYNTGNFSRGFTNGYVEKVAAKAGVVGRPAHSVIVATGGEANSAQRPRSSDVFGSTRADVFGVSQQGFGSDTGAVDQQRSNDPVRLTAD